MKIKELSVENYRNLSDDTITFDDTCNFIVGENNIGKSNLLNLLNVIFSKKGFDEDDFKRPNEKIKVNITLELSDYECEKSKKIFELEKQNKQVKIVCIQESSTDDLKFYKNSPKGNSPVPSTWIRSHNYVYYDSLRNPATEINFDKHRGVGRFLSKLVKRLHEENTLDKSRVSRLVAELNDSLEKIKTFSQNKISVTTVEESYELIGKQLALSVGNKKGKTVLLSQSGYGIQFVILVTLAILNNLQDISDSKDEVSSISVVFGLDEPEIHLHPCMQRILIKFLVDIVQSRDNNFRNLLTDLFQIENFGGQIIVSTHSPYLIPDDYRQIIRLYESKNETHMVSGWKLKLRKKGKNKQGKENLLHQLFPFVKEAFFSRCAIIVEGYTEMICIPLFAKKMQIDFDDFGINVLNAGGKKSVPGLVGLMGAFHIPAVGIEDRDDEQIVDQSSRGRLFKTQERDFESELVNLINDENKSRWIEVFRSVEGMDTAFTLTKCSLGDKKRKKYRLVEDVISNVTNREKLSLKLEDIQNEADIKLVRCFFLCWLISDKSPFFRRKLGEVLPLEFIPKVYQDAINSAKEKSLAN